MSLPARIVRAGGPILILLSWSGANAAAATLDAIPGEVIQAEGTKQELAKRATVCITQNVRQERGGPDTIRATDPDGGMVVANVLFTYTRTGVPWTVRSTFTVETKDGRFRMTQTNLAQHQGAEAGGGLAEALGLNPKDGNWTPVYTGFGTGSAKVEEAARAFSAKVAACIKAAPAAW